LLVRVPKLHGTSTSARAPVTPIRIPAMSNPVAIAFETPFRRTLNGFPVYLIRLMDSKRALIFETHDLGGSRRR